MSSQTRTLADAYLLATNRSDSTGFLALFADAAVVDDGGRVFRGRDAIKEWSDREIFGAEVVLAPMDLVEREGEAVITTKVDGNFDRTGLPDPVIISHHVKSEGDQIIELTCRLVGEPSAP